MADSADGGGGSFAEFDSIDEVRSILHALGDGVFTLDRDGTVEAVNDALVEMTGYSREELLGGSLATVLDGDAATRFRTVVTVLQDAHMTDPATAELPVVTAGGSRIPCEFRLSPYGSGEAIEGVVGTVRDRSGQRERDPRAGAGEEDTVAGHYESLVDDVLDSADVGVFVLDSAYRVAWINETTERYFGLDRESVVGRDKRAVVEERIRDAVERSDAFAERVLATYADDTGPESFQCHVLPGEDREERWLEHRSKPIERGRYAGGRVELYYDVTDQHRIDRALAERDRQLREETAFTESVLEAQPDVVYAFDVEGRMLRWNDRFREVTGYEDARIADMRAVEFLADEAVDRATAAMEPVIVEGETTTVEVPLETADGERIPYQFSVAPLTYTDGTVVGFTGVGRDVSRRKARTERLQRQRDELEAELADVFDRIADGFFALNEDWRFTYVNDRAAADLARPGAELLGADVWETFPGLAESTFERECRRAMRTQEVVVFEEYVDPLERWFSVRVYPSESGLSVYLHDVTERKMRERALRESEQRFRAVFEGARDAIVISDDEGRYVDANPAACDLFGLSLEELRGRSIAEFAADRYDVEAEWESFNEAGESEGTFPLVRPDGTERLVEYRARADVLPGKHLSILRDVTDQERRERKLERQRERLAALDDLNSVVRDITDAVIEQSTREEIERIVCEQLAASDTYRFAWIATVDPATNSLTPRVEAGVDGYLEEIPLSVDPDDPAGQGPGGKAVANREIQVTRNAFDDPDFELWREYAREYDYRASAAIPIQYEGTLYSVLGLYTGREDAFTDEEREVVGQLGEVVGHAIAAVERKRALMSDELLELEFVVEDVFAERDVSTATGERLLLDQAVPVGDEEYLVYGTAVGGAAKLLDALVENDPDWRSSRVVAEEPDGVRFEARLSEPPILTAIASRGGEVTDAQFADGDFLLTAHVPHSVGVRQVVEAVEEVYPTAELRAQRQVRREADGVERAASAFEGELTDSQRSAVETAYFSGYFEWPRHSAGEEVAEALGISPATFSQHLREAERRVFQAVLEERDSPADEADSGEP